MRRSACGFVALAFLTLTGCASAPPAAPPAPTPPAPASAPPAAPAGPREITTPSGLRYQDLVVGDGPLAEEGMKVAVNYTGWLLDGTKFDSSYDRNAPFTFTLGAGMVIRGWDEGVKGMRVGGKRRLTIPSDLAYGDNGYPGAIPPRATLVFEVELLNAGRAQ